MESSNKYSVKLITNENQLSDAFRFRYNTYKNIYPEIVKDHPLSYESDSFDKRSIHIGLFNENENQKKLIGYSRMIIPPFFVKSYESLFVKQHPYYLFTEESNERNSLLYLIDDLNIKHEINVYCENHERNNIVYSETGRLMIDENHRSLTLVSFFVLSFFAISQVLNIRLQFFGCTPMHLAFYRRFGLNLFKDYRELPFKCVGKKALLTGYPCSPIAKIKSSIEGLKEQFNNENQISLKMLLSKAA